MNKKQIEKNIKKYEEWRKNFRNTPYGSLIETCNILLQKNISDGELIKKVKKAEFPLLDSKDFIKETVEAVGIDFEKVKQLPICCIKSDWNVLFLPYIKENGDIIPMPIDENGQYPQTFYKASSIEIIDWTNINDE